METKDYLRILEEDIHTTVMANVDGKGHPVTRVIDIMMEDGKALMWVVFRL